MTKLDDLTKSHILLQYCRQAAAGVRHKFNTGTSLSVECPFCGTKEIKGTIFMSNTNRLCYICWKASCPCSSKAVLATKWLKEVDSTAYAAYKAEISKIEQGESKEVENLNQKIEEENSRLMELQQKELERRRWRDNESTKKFVKITDGSELSKTAIAYCESRHIPEEIWKKFYIAHEGKYHDRVIIPFFNKDGKIQYFQGRSLIGAEPKYMNRCSTETYLYNKDFIDPSKPVCVLEGPIDSMFIENAVATCGAGSSAKLDKIISEFDYPYYIMDNDTAGNKKAGMLVRNHKYVFLWSKFLNDKGLPLDSVKDINDVILKLGKTDKFKFDELQDYFTNITDEFLCYL